ncbi:MAG: SDR family oxidoreductase [Rhodobacteraceae bacterium]|jgi:NAD(P)-dependent dehydrogenase (short-subunit alcohol dehydrogenase family)|nr:SDR family oxidoreductase [Paracoccaceae bacterium]
MKKLEHKVALITGAGQGIGEAIANAFAREGASVVVADLNPESGRAVAAKIVAETSAKVIAITTDVANSGSVKAAVLATRKTFGPVDVLVNNAGIAVFGKPLETTDADWRRCMSVDVEGAWHCAREVLPEMLSKGSGAIINIISNHSFSVIKETFPYPVAKHALLGLTRSLALEYADKGIAVNAISPGYTETPLVDAHFAAQSDPMSARSKIIQKQPVGRLCQPNEIAAVATLLASDEARFIIGENIVIDGGVSIRMYED